MLKLATKFKPGRQAFENACRAGFRWAELWLGPDVLAGWQEVLPLARSHPLGYALHFPNRLDLGPDHLGQVVGLYRILWPRRQLHWSDIELSGRAALAGAVVLTPRCRWSRLLSCPPRTISWAAWRSTTSC